MTSKENENSTEIAPLRAAIDAIDERIVELINERLLIGKRIGEIKALTGDSVLDKSRENEIMKRLSRLNKGPVKDTVLHYTFSVIIAASREIQRPQIVSYLGPEATNTHVAALEHFGHSGRFVPQERISDIFAEVERMGSRYGVVPVENSIEGAVNQTLDLLFLSDLKICAEKYQPISHDLMSQSGNLEEIEVVYSHPQALAQCARWIETHLPGCDVRECSSTAEAAKRAAGESGGAAVAARKAAQLYDLKIVESRIEDFSKNITRFLVIGRDEIAATGDDKTTLMFVTRHEPGALSKVLAPIAESGLNMVKLESRPIKQENWNYFFVMDIEGHMEEDGMKDSFRKMQEHCLFLKSLGSYPKAKGGYQEIEVSK